VFKESLYPKTEQVLNKIKDLSLIQNYYLAGGTALALQLGHRKSIDLDFFTDNFPKIETLIQELSKFNPQIISQNENTLDVLIDGVKVSFLEYKYKMNSPLKTFEGVNVADIIDIACMKLTAVSSRGSKKDFIDLYFILQQYPLEYLLEQFKSKYVGVQYSIKHILKSLIYFEDAEQDPEVDYLNGEGVSWDLVKSKIVEITEDYLKGIQSEI